MTLKHGQILEFPSGEYGVVIEDCRHDNKTKYIIRTVDRDGCLVTNSSCTNSWDSLADMESENHPPNNPPTEIQKNTIDQILKGKM